MKMHNENIHPVLKTPPLAHALHKWDEKRRTLSYEYNGVDVFTLSIEGNETVGFRHGSDGNINNGPFIQQIYVMLDDCRKPVRARFRIRLNRSAVPMAPERAKDGAAIRGRASESLSYGIGGFYDRDWDFLLSWHGVDWGWTSDRMLYEGEYAVAQGWMTLTGKPLYVNLLMHYYRRHLGFRYHEPWRWKPKSGALAGWCSWEAYRREISQDHLDNLVPFLREKFGRYGLEYIQVDDGYQQMPIPPTADGLIARSWLSTNHQFPEGHKGILQSIGDNGFTPAIWTNVNVTHEDFGSVQKEDVICDEKGEPLHGEWIDFLMNCNEPMLKKHVDPYYRGLYEMGYRYFKTDAIRHLLMDGLHEAVRLGVLSNEEAREKFRRFIEHAREEIRDSVFLASWGVMEEVVGAADACRIAMDANPTWAGMRMQIMETARWFHTQRILFVIDADHLCARAETEWVRTVSSLISLTGGVYMLSDPLEAYDGDRVSIIRRSLPPCETVCSETGPMKMDFPAFTWTKLHGFAVPREEPVKAEPVSEEESLNMAGNYPGMDSPHPFGSLWSFSFSRPGLQWDVILRTAVVPLGESELDHQGCGIDPSCSHLVFDFWNERFLGRWEAGDCRFSVPPLELGHCQVLAVQRESGPIQYLGDNRHVSCGLETVESAEYGPGITTVKYRSVEDSELTMFFYKGAKEVSSVTSENPLQYEVCDDIIKVMIDIKRKEDILKIQWD